MKLKGILAAALIAGPHDVVRNGPGCTGHSVVARPRRAPG